ncbi:spermatogenesis-associated protein 9 isoform X2 [Notamacropus eugenii]
MYLSSRVPIVLNFNPFITFKRDPQESYNNQLVRATNLTVSAIKFLNSLRSRILEPDIYYVNPEWSKSKIFKRFLSLLPTSVSWYGAYFAEAYPLDMSQYVHLFNSSRVPKEGKDELFSDHSARHLLVMRNGHFYVFDILDPIGNILHPYEIQAHLINILQDGETVAEYPLGYLTTENRNTWAAVREQLLQAGNEESIYKIDSAIFCLCLDSFKIQNSSHLSHCMLHGYGYNRWFDKSFSLIVTVDGSAGINFEHSWGDGVSVLRFLNEVYADSTKHPAVVPRSTAAVVCPTHVEKLQFHLNESIQSAVTVAHQKFENLRHKMTVKPFEFRKFGKQYVIQERMSPDAIFQLACQVAAYRHFGKVVPTYEACSTAGFKHGRTETIRSATVYTKQCAQAFIRNRRKYSAQDLRKLIDSSSKYHKFLQMEAALVEGLQKAVMDLLDEYKDEFPTVLRLSQSNQKTDVVPKASKTRMAINLAKIHAGSVLQGLHKISRSSKSVAKLLQPQLAHRLLELKNISHRLLRDVNTPKQPLYKVKVRKGSLLDVISFPAKTAFASMMYASYAALIYLTVCINALLEKAKNIFQEEESIRRNKKDNFEVRKAFSEPVFSEFEIVAKPYRSLPENTDAVLLSDIKLPDIKLSNKIQVLHSVFDQSTEMNE